MGRTKTFYRLANRMQLSKETFLGNAAFIDLIYFTRSVTGRTNKRMWSYEIYDFILSSILHANRNFLPFKERRSSKQLTVRQFLTQRRKSLLFYVPERKACLETTLVSM